MLNEGLVCRRHVLKGGWLEEEHQLAARGDARQRFAEQVRGLVGTLGDVHYR